jgi:hypothetical protein
MATVGHHNPSPGLYRVSELRPGTARVDTDLGEGYIKALGNPEGPHILACELIGSHAGGLARPLNSGLCLN